MLDSCFIGVLKFVVFFCYRQEISRDINSQLCIGVVCRSGNFIKRLDILGEY